MINSTGRFLKIRRHECVTPREGLPCQGLKKMRLSSPILQGRGRRHSSSRREFVEQVTDGQEVSALATERERIGIGKKVKRTIAGSTSNCHVVG
jgi:hypothetical protein